MKVENPKFYTYCRVGTEKQLYFSNEQKNQEQAKIEVIKNEQS